MSIDPHGYVVRSIRPAGDGRRVFTLVDAWGHVSVVAISQRVTVPAAVDAVLRAHVAAAPSTERRPA